MRRIQRAEIEAAAERCKARGVSTLYPLEWEAAMRAELGITVEEQEAHERECRDAADARLARGEKALHEARQDALEGGRSVRPRNPCAPNAPPRSSPSSGRLH